MLLNRGGMGGNLSEAQRVLAVCGGGEIGFRQSGNNLTLLECFTSHTWATNGAAGPQRGEKVFFMSCSVWVILPLRSWTVFQSVLGPTP